MIAGTAEQFDVLSRMKSVRLPGAVRFSQSLVEFGMLYFGIKDKL